VNHGKDVARGEAIDQPLSTITATQRGHALVTPSLLKLRGTEGSGRYGTPPDAPLPTICAGATTFGVVAPTLIQTGYGEREGQAARVPGLQKPLGTLVNGQKHALIGAFLAKHFGERPGGFNGGDPLDGPMGTVTTRDHHGLAAAALVKFRGNEENGHPGCAPVDEPLPTISAGGGKGGVHVAEVRAFLTAYYGEDGTSGQSLLEPLRTITAKHRLGLVTIEGTEYQIVDIGLRMLEPDELARAQYGRFAPRFDLSRAKTKSKKVQLIGNSVCPEVSEALVRANVRGRKREAVA
jgi:DNA (cytosine-5)-methyltransferase 1